MSLAKIKAKETKGKQKLLPKLKTILADPDKVKCPILNEQDLEHLQIILQNAIKESKLDSKCYVTTKRIQLGLESSLRSINGKKSSCVFISLSVKPSHIVSLIARNAKVIDETQPVFAQPRLEDFLEKIFGIRALCMVLPKNLMDISEEIFKWVEQRKIPRKITKLPVKLKSLKKSNIKQKNNTDKTLQKSKDTHEEEQSPKTLPKSWSGDFVSFSSNDNVEIDKLNINEDQAVKALSEIIDRIPIKPKIPEKFEPMDLDLSKDFNCTDQVEEDVDSDDCDHFLGEYKSLTVHKIKGNPNKKPKKKRKKNKQKNNSK